MTDRIFPNACSGLVAALLLCPAPLPALAPTAPRTVEAGLETAVKWRWQVAPSDPAVWGWRLDDDPSATGSTAPGGKSLARPAANPSQHTVGKGDSLYAISRRYGLSVEQLQLANDLKTEIIHPGQVLRIPTMAELRALQPPPPPLKPGQNTPAPAPKKAPERQLPQVARASARIVLLQAYLDRQGFSTGPIDGQEGMMFDAALAAYEAEHPGELTFDAGRKPAVLEAMGEAFTDYALKFDDLRWINPPAAAEKNRDKATTTPPEPTWESLIAEPFLAYRSAWEFVAERFHCSESFLRRINPGVKTPERPGSVFLVPNVAPFEIETALADPIRPRPDPAAPVTASIIGGTRLEIRLHERLIARPPVSAARPGLRGRGTWKVLGTVPRPRLISTGEPSDAKKGAPPPPAPELVLPPGPNNPVGLLWLNLAKKGSDSVLPYGLHGTSIPGYLTRQESVGGFRMTNWDIVRTARLLPEGTELKWQ
jgi:LysM repeat protein/lipoprotein-anchoring transpeptidase ErfK/SrfK